MIHAKLLELSRVVQYLDETFAEYNNRVRFLMILVIATFHGRSKSE